MKHTTQQKAYTVKENLRIIKKAVSIDIPNQLTSLTDKVSRKNLRAIELQLVVTTILGLVLAQIILRELTKIWL